MIPSSGWVAAPTLCRHASSIHPTDRTDACTGALEVTLIVA